MCDVLKVKRSELPLQKYVDEEHLKKAEKLAKERATHRPLQYVLGYQDFYGQKITVSEGVLVPRPETEILAKLTAEISENKKVLDLCTGSGAIAVAVKKLCPAADVTASDVSEKALEIASYNASLNDAEVKFVLSDVFANVVENTTSSFQIRRIFRLPTSKNWTVKSRISSRKSRLTAVRTVWTFIVKSQRASRSI